MAKETRDIVAGFRELIAFARFNEVYDAAADYIQRTFRADCVFLGVHRTGPYKFIHGVTTNSKNQVYAGYSVPSWGKVIVNHVMGEVRCIRTRLPQTDPQLGYQPTYAVDMAYPGFSEALCCPIKLNGSCCGVLYVHYDRGRVDFREWSEPGLLCLYELARILSVFIEISEI